MILTFPRLGNAIFGWFWLSQDWETQFSGDSDFPKGGKRSFRVILTFPRVGNAVFGWFWLSQDWETQKMSVFSFPRGWKRSFWAKTDDLLPYLSRITRFLTIYSRIRAELPNFWRFTPVSEQNHPIFDDLLPYLGGFFRFSVHRRPTTASFCEFLLVVGVRNAVFAVFCSS